MLVRSGIEQANKMSIDIFLVAMGRKALGMYKKHGFELLDTSSQSLNPWGADELYETFVLIKHASKSL